MGTVVTIEVVDEGSEDAVDRAFGWFGEIERLCNRFDPQSELRQVAAQAGVARAASEILYTALEFAIAVAQETDGAFDPTVGHLMETRGFNRNYRTGHVVSTPLESDEPVSFRDVHLDPVHRTVTLRRPLVLDLGAIAKGLAIDLAARELVPFENYAIDAGGDLYLAGRNGRGEPWSVEIHHPRRDREIIECLRVSDVAVCTSGDYERRGSGNDGGHHLLDPRSGRPADRAVSATVVAPTAMLADALATAAFVLGPDDGLRLLERHDVDGLVVSPTLEPFATRGMRSGYSLDRSAASAVRRGAAVLPNS